MNLDRRRFLQVAAVGVIAAIGYPLYRRRVDREDRDIARPQLLAILGRERVRELGTHYRSATPSENSTIVLRAALIDSRGVQASLIGPRSFDDRIRDDFAAGRTVLVDGWVLSLTEARQAALYSLSS